MKNIDRDVNHKLKQSNKQTKHTNKQTNKQARITSIIKIYKYKLNNKYKIVII